MRLLLVFAALSLAMAVGCGPDTPFCTDAVDMTGRPLIQCPNPRDSPVCDDPGDEARYEDLGMGFELVGGSGARCDSSTEEVLCINGAEESYCLRDPRI